MTTARKWFIIACIMAAGLLVAAPFRREKPKTRQARNGLASPRFHSSDSDPLLSISSNSQSQGLSDQRFIEPLGTRPVRNREFASADGVAPSFGSTSNAIDARGRQLVQRFRPDASAEHPNTENKESSPRIFNSHDATPIPRMENRYEPIVQKSAIGQMEERESKEHFEVFEKTENLRDALSQTLLEPGTSNVANGQANPMRNESTTSPTEARLQQDSRFVDEQNRQWQSEAVGRANEQPSGGSPFVNENWEPLGSGQDLRGLTRPQARSQVATGWTGRGNQDALNPYPAPKPLVSPLPPVNDESFNGRLRIQSASLNGSSSNSTDSSRGMPNRSDTLTRRDMRIRIPSGNAGRPEAENSMAAQQAYGRIERLPEIGAEYQGQGRGRENSAGRLQPGTTQLPRPNQGSSARNNRQGSGRLRTYVLRDGDTLPLIAERFLGDRSRYLEILELNRDVIPHPGVLPLRQTIKIPPR